VTLTEFFSGRKVLVTGAAGTVGAEIVRQLDAMGGCGELRLVDNNESEMFFLMERYRGRNVRCFLGDVRDGEKLMQLAEGIDVIVHAAAFKHVILSEYNPFDVVQTNIIGVENVVRAARANRVGHVLFTSSDKAVNPTNVMGTSKLMGERLVSAANSLRSEGATTVYSSTRFGNVIGSRGSVVPLFARQIRAGGPLTITDMHMTRFVMTVAEAASLVLRSVMLARGGEVFVTKMPVVRIPDLARAMINILAPRMGRDPGAIELKVIGAKPGEKLYEELMSDEERHRSLELREMFVVLPAFKAIYSAISYDYPEMVSEKIEKSYVSATETVMSVEEISSYLIEHGVLDEGGE
jgi:FlaA1/EpsC-like NDP-sugar epimerase